MIMISQMGTDMIHGNVMDKGTFSSIFLNLKMGKSLIDGNVRLVILIFAKSVFRYHITLKRIKLIGAKKIGVLILSF